MIAAAVTSYDGSSESIEDEDIGTIKFYMKSWNVKENEGLSWKELKSRPCQKSDFAQKDDSIEDLHRTGFYNTNPVSVADIGTYGKKLKCIDDEFTISGNYDTSIASNLQVVFQKCDPQIRVCKS